MAVTPEQARDALQVVINSLQHQRELFVAFAVAAVQAAEQIEDVLVRLQQEPDKDPTG